MVFLAITRSGYDSWRSLGSVAGALWLAAGVVSDDELSELRAAGIDVSHFNYAIGLDQADVLAGALDTIKEHHPGQTVWVQS